MLVSTARATDLLAGDTGANTRGGVGVQQGRKARIMVVEDEALIALDLERRLRGLGYEVVGVADDFETAVETFTETPPDLCLVDINLRGSRDGVEVATELTRRRDVPVIFVTAYHDEETVRRASKVSPYGYLIKPYDDRTLAVNISIALERHASDQRLHLYRSALASATVGIAIVDREVGTEVPAVQGRARARLVYSNDAYLALSGYTRDQLTGSQPCFLAAAPDDPAVRVLIDAVERGISGTAEFQGKRADGQVFWSSVHMSPVTRVGQDPRYMLVFHIDVTRQHEAERALGQKQRLELMGRLSAGIAHDFNNVLGAVVALVELARESESLDEARGLLDEIGVAVKSGTRLTRKLLNSSRPTADRPMTPSDLGAVVRAARTMVERLVGSKIKVELRLAPQPMFIRCDETAIEQILLNLVTNARDAMKGEGRLAIAAEVYTPDVSSGPQRRHVRFSVTDSGSGMDEATQRKIFDPFFTTKEAGVGTGLGLATTKMLVEQAGGGLSVRSALGEGTTFVLDLPLVDAVVEDASDAAAGEPMGNAGGATCLVVEDEPALLRAYGRALTKAGFQVLDAGSGAAGLQLMAAHAASIRLVITDMVLPGMSGSRILERASVECPTAAKLVITGYMDDSGPPLPADVPMLWKPCSPSAVARAALHALDTVAAQPARSVQEALRVAETAPGPATGPRSRAMAAATGAATGSATGSVEERAGLDVLLVEDDEQLRPVLAQAMRSRGLRVVEASTVAAAVALAAADEPQLLVTDIHLPDRDGLSLVGELRQTYPRMPILVMSGGLSGDHARRAIEGRINGFLAKPFPTAEFVREVDRALNEGHVARLQHGLLLCRAPEAMLADIATTERQFEESLAALHMAYQPIVRAHDHSIFAFEALLRSRGPLGSPPALLAAADVLNRVEDLGRVIRRSIADTLALHAERFEAIFVNLHPNELRAELLLGDDEPLAAFAPRVVLEVTERAQLSSSGALQDTLAQLRGAGYRIALDDLGEGYAGLNWLVKLSPDIAKIDMTLVRDIHTSKIKRELVSSLINVCRRAGTAVVAEGVERVEEATTLADLGADLLQGYYFSKPAPPFPAVARR
jgi:PAS domain S-box-containing protein